MFFSYFNLIFRFRARDEVVYVSLLPWLRMSGAAPPPIYFSGVHGKNFIFIPFMGAGGRVSHLLDSFKFENTLNCDVCD